MAQPLGRHGALLSANNHRLGVPWSASASPRGSAHDETRLPAAHGLAPVDRLERQREGGPQVSRSFCFWSANS
jgi:hypothetical protein